MIAGSIALASPRRLRSVARLLLVATCLTASAASAEQAPEPAPGTDPLLTEFRDAPAESRPRVWWHWMNGNISKDGIAKDLAWMKRIGIAGAQNFDANLTTPQIVDKRLVYMTSEWKDAFGFAAAEADRLGLELAIASSPGWSETGGPWVLPQDGLKKLVWSETEVPGGVRFVGRLAPPPAVTGPFQALAKPAAGPGAPGASQPAAPALYDDIAVLALPGGEAPLALASAEVQGRPLAAAPLGDGDLATGAEVEARGTTQEPRAIVVAFDGPRTVRSANVFLTGATMPYIGALFHPRLEVSSGGSWRTLADVPVSDVPVTVAFPAVTASRFRLVLAPRSEALGMLAQLGAGAARFTGGGDPSAIFARPLRVEEFRLSAEDRIDRAEAKAAFALTPDYFALSRGLGDSAGVLPGAIVNLTGRMRPDGTLDWAPPPRPGGRGWRVLRLGWSLTGKTNQPAPPEATGLEVDKFDGPAVRSYLEHYLGMYKDASGGLIGDRGVRALLTDSIEVGAANWTPRLIEQFKRLRGYDPTRWLPALTGIIVGSRADSDKFLFDFRRTLADLMASEHYGTVAAVAHEHGLKVYGEALEDQRPVIGDDMAMRRYADVPMGAMWTYPRQAGPKLTYIADIKGAASVAHIYGQNLVAAESLTAPGPVWGYAPADLKRVIDLEFALGVNLPVIHTSVHAAVDDKKPGLSLGGIGQYFNRHETWAEMSRPWVDYIARNSLMLQQGRHVADVAYFYGEEAPLTGLFGEKPVADAPKAYAYDFVNADALMSALTNDGADLVTSSGARYRALYLGGSSQRMTLPVLRRLAQLVGGGATVIGFKPEANPSLAGNAAEWNALVDRLWPASEDKPVIESRDVEAALRSLGVTPDFIFGGGQPDTEILFLHRKLADGDSYFLSNRKDRSESIEARFRVTGKAPELWHAESGTSEPVSYRIAGGATIVPLTLAADQSLHVVFRKPAVADALALEKAVPTELAQLDGPWQVAFQPGRGAPAAERMRALAPLNEHVDPGIKYFSGVASYTSTFAAPRRWRAGKPLWLDLGEVREVAEVWVNGKLAGAAWHAPYRVEVGQQAKAGSNTLEIRIANLWVNRLIGDAQPGEQKVTWTDLQAYPADAPLRRSGLIGPVVLLGTK